MRDDACPPSGGKRSRSLSGYTNRFLPLTREDFRFMSPQLTGLPRPSRACGTGSQ